MRKKILAGMLVALMAVSMLTGCSGRPDNAKNNSAADDSKKKTEKVELTVWAGAEDREYLKKVADNFIKEHSSEADISIIHKDMVWMSPPPGRISGTIPTSWSSCGV